jgi:hypothetical protein
LQAFSDFLKKIKKSLKKGLTNGKVCDRIAKLSRESEAKAKQRDSTNGH